MRRITLLTIGLLLTSVSGAWSQDGDPEPPVEMVCPCREPVVWASAEYLLWWIKDGPLLPLLTMGDVADDPAIGALGEPGTQILMGGNNTDYGARSGGRFAAGVWLDDARTWGLEATYLFLPETRVEQVASSSGLAGSAFLTIPFFDPTTSSETSALLSQPSLFSTTVLLSQTSVLQGAEINAVVNVTPLSRLRIDLLSGFRYLYLREKLALATSSPAVPPFPVDVLTTGDEFNTNNNFYGGQFGARVECSVGRLFLNTAAKVAFGAVQQSVNVTGFLLTNDFNALGTPQPFPGGYLALPTNVGVYHRSRFAVVPEVNVNLGYQLPRGARIFIGYSFLYASAVARPGSQIDRVINPSQSVAHTFDPGAALVGVARPIFDFGESSFWAQGINFGLELRF